MVSYSYVNKRTRIIPLVLILIVVEDGLVLIDVKNEPEKLKEVLILVVVDDGHVPRQSLFGGISRTYVLILVVVDNGLVQLARQFLQL